MVFTTLKRRVCRKTGDVDCLTFDKEMNAWQILRQDPWHVYAPRARGPVGARQKGCACVTLGQEVWQCLPLASCECALSLPTHTTTLPLCHLRDCKKHTNKLKNLPVFDVLIDGNGGAAWKRRGGASASSIVFALKCVICEISFYTQAESVK